LEGKEGYIGYVKTEPFSSTSISRVLKTIKDERGPVLKKESET
jgi:hypothetical protein